MSIAVRALTVAAFAAAFAAGAWVMRNQAPPPPPQPPLLADPRNVDPEVAKFVEQTLADVRRSPRDPALRAKLAMVYHANGMPALAEAAYQQAITLDGGDARLWHRMSHARAEQGDLVGALGAIEHCIGLEGSYAPAHWQRGFWLLDLGRIDQAEASFRRAVELRPAEAAGRVGLARVHMQRKLHGEAAAQLRDVIAAGGASTPNRPYIRQLLGTAERNMGQAGPASVHLARGRGNGGTVKWPDEWMSDVSRLCVGYRAALDELEHLVAIAQYDAAMAQAAELLKKKPGDVAALNWLAIAHLKSNQIEAGIGLLHEALASDPNHYATHLNLAHAYEGTGEPERALSHAQRAAEINPGVGETHAAVGRLLMRAGRSEEAVVSLTAAVEAGANEPEVRVRLGEALMTVRRWPDAVRVFEQAVQSAPDAAEAFAGLALARAEAGALPKARLALQRAAQLNPNLPMIRQVAARIGEIESHAAK